MNPKTIGNGLKKKKKKVDDLPNSVPFCCFTLAPRGGKICIHFEHPCLKRYVC